MLSAFSASLEKKELSSAHLGAQVEALAFNWNAQCLNAPEFIYLRIVL